MINMSGAWVVEKPPLLIASVTPLLFERPKNKVQKVVFV